MPGEILSLSYMDSGNTDLTQNTTNATSIISSCSSKNIFITSIFHLIYILNGALPLLFKLYELGMCRTLLSCAVL